MPMSFPSTSIGHRTGVGDDHAGVGVTKLEGRSREVVVKVLADREPTPPTRTPFELVEFENLTVTPYVDSGRCQGRGKCTARMAFSLRATGLKAARPVVARMRPDARPPGHHRDHAGRWPLRGGFETYLARPRCSHLAAGLACSSR